MFLFRRNLSDKKMKDSDFLSVILYLLPTGVIYFVFLDFADLVFAIARLISLIRLDLFDIKQYEDVMAKKVARMDRMNWEGLLNCFFSCIVFFTPVLQFLGIGIRIRIGIF